MNFWHKDAGVKLGLMKLGKPTQNAIVESLNGKFRNECLDQHWFLDIDDAKNQIEVLRDHCDTERLHSSLELQPPVVFAAQAA